MKDNGMVVVSNECKKKMGGIDAQTLVQKQGEWSLRVGSIRNMASYTVCNRLFVLAAPAARRPKTF